MSDIVAWIEKAGADLGRLFLRCAPAVAQEVVTSSRARFVQGNPRVWWLGLSNPHVSYESRDRSFLEVVPDASERVWFIAEDDSEDLPGYDLDPAEVELIRHHCPLFEYYVTDKRFRWLVIESDHDEFLVCRSSQEADHGQCR